MAGRARGRVVIVAAAAAVAAAAVGVSGCGNAAFSRRELVVHFSTTATTHDRDAARAACAGAAPRTSAETPDPTSSFASTRQNDVRFRIDHANDKDVSQLAACLDRQPGVVGIAIPDVAS